ncbi:MAG: hypothetical protein IPM68_01675 [Flavobacteriales bacterium]|nr:hypothetical protein [Flavobacteriales bacterium]
MNTDSGQLTIEPACCPTPLTRGRRCQPLTLFYGSGVVAALYGVLGLKLDLAASIGLFLVGAFLFTLVEYLVHRYFYHVNGGSPKPARGTFHGPRPPARQNRLALAPASRCSRRPCSGGLFRLLLGIYGEPSAEVVVGYATCEATPAPLPPPPELPVAHPERPPQPPPLRRHGRRLRHRQFALLEPRVATWTASRAQARGRQRPEPGRAAPPHGRPVGKAPQATERR